ncbi:hypothetical protein D777_03508 [Marinobacter nitratireducens]|uniref:Putative zinc-finger domain-containing protein n=2 Tax=Marinobacter nitratireducens TaxID=1137280 RepID=A0A072MZ99_9GAMM|nr:hypothetical protein D777_03508 [Marinobacter nitratireducens]
MSCREIRISLTAYIHDELSEEQTARVDEHLHHCESCSVLFAAERKLAEELNRRTAIPEPTSDFRQRVLAKATKQPQVAGWSHGVLAGAVAAAMVFGVAVGIYFTERSVDTMPTVAEETLKPVEQTVRLAFHSGEALENVTLTLELPPHVELASMPGRHEVSWEVSLDAGENMLSLPLKVLFPGSGELVAHINAGDRQKTFRAAIPAFNNLQTGSPAS